MIRYGMSGEIATFKEILVLNYNCYVKERVYYEKQQQIMLTRERFIESF